MEAAKDFLAQMFGKRQKPQTPVSFGRRANPLPPPETSERNLATPTTPTRPHERRGTAMPERTRKLIEQIVSETPGSILTPQAEFNRKEEGFVGIPPEFALWALQKTKLRNETLFYLLMENQGEDWRMAACISAGEEAPGTVGEADGASLAKINDILNQEGGTMTLVIGHVHCAGTIQEFGAYYADHFSGGDKRQMNAIRQDPDSSGIDGFLLVGKSQRERGVHFIYEKK